MIGHAESIWQKGISSLHCVKPETKIDALLIPILELLDTPSSLFLPTLSTKVETVYLD